MGEVSEPKGRVRRWLADRKLARSVGSLRRAVRVHPDHGEWWVALRLDVGEGKVPEFWARVRPFLLPLATDEDIADVLRQNPEREGTRVMDLHMRGAGGSPIEAVIYCYGFLYGHLGDDTPPIEAVLVEPFVEGQAGPSGSFALTPYQQRVREAA